MNLHSSHTQQICDTCDALLDRCPIQSDTQVIKENKSLRESQRPDFYFNFRFRHLSNVYNAGGESWLTPIFNFFKSYSMLRLSLIRLPTFVRERRRFCCPKSYWRTPVRERDTLSLNPHAWNKTKHHTYLGRDM